MLSDKNIIGDIKNNERSSFIEHKDKKLEMEFKD